MYVAFIVTITAVGMSGRGVLRLFRSKEDRHYLTVLRYVEHNPLRADLAGRAENGNWSSLYALMKRSDYPFLSDGPIDRPCNWLRLVNQQQPEAELEAIRNSVNRGAPF